MSNFKSDAKTTPFLVTVMAIMVFTACSEDSDFEWEVEHTTRGLVLGATADTYNINDKDFTADIWCQQDAIYLYDEEGRYKTDDLGRHEIRGSEESLRRRWR